MSAEPSAEPGMSTPHLYPGSIRRCLWGKCSKAGVVKLMYAWEPYTLLGWFCAEHADAHVEVGSGVRP